MFAACNLLVLLACLSTGPRLTIIVLTFSVLLQVVGGDHYFHLFWTLLRTNKIAHMPIPFAHLPTCG